MNTTTRRALIGGAGLAAVVAAVPAIAVVRAPAVSTAKWDALALAFLKADAHMKAVGLEHNEAYKRYAVAREALGPRPIKPQEWDCVYPKPIEQMTIAEFKALPMERSPEYDAYEVALAAWKAEDDALETRLTGDVDARWEDAVSAQTEAADALLAEPSPTAGAVQVKMRLIEVSYEGSEIPTDIAKAIFADVNRFLSKEA